MEKGYLLILVGAIFAANLSIPMPSEFSYWWTRLTFWGFIFISLGMRQIRGTEKELKYAQFFTMLSLLVRLGLPWISDLFPTLDFTLVLAFNLLLVFSPLAIFFWFFKSEYLWSPSSTKRVDWYIYSAISLIYLILNVVLILPIIVLAMPSHVVMILINVRQFFNLLYHIVLVGLLVKLYLAAKNDTGLSRWN
jgi:hypothetical protein